MGVSPHLYAFISSDCYNFGRRKGERARKIDEASPFSFWRKAQSGDCRIGGGWKEKNSRWTKGSRLLISNVSDYVGLGSLRFFIQTKKGERSGREARRPGSLTTWLSNSSSVVVRFVLHPDVSRMSSRSSRRGRSPLRGLVRFLLFYTVSYFRALRRAGWPHDVDLSRTSGNGFSRSRFSSKGSFETLSVIVEPLIFAAGQMPCVTDRMIDSSENLSGSTLERVEFFVIFLVGVNLPGARESTEGTNRRRRTALL